MNYFREYIISVCAILALTSVASEILVDFSWSKYINLICAILFSVCLINPILSLVDGGFPAIDIKNESQPDNDYISENVSNEFSFRLADIIKSDVKEKFGDEIHISVRLTEDNKLCIIFNKPVRENIYDYIKEAYKPDTIRIFGE